MKKEKPTPAYIVFYDSDCLMCDGFIRFLVKRDKKELLRYAPLQSDLWHSLQEKSELKWSKYGTVVFKDKDRWHSESTAVLQIFKTLNLFPGLTLLLMTIPLRVRDFVYRWIARNRYKWFGGKKSCTQISPEHRHLFLGIRPVHEQHS